MSSEEPTLRAFLALKPTEPWRRRVVEVQQECQRSLRGEMVRWLDPEQIHLTLKFLGNVPAASLPELKQALQRACQGARPFVLRAAGLGCFPRPERPRVVWIGIDGALEELRSLQRKIDAETDVWAPPEQREFQPHLTIGRVRHCHADQARALANWLAAGRGGAPVPWEVHRVELVQSRLSSHGPLYASLAWEALS